MKMTQENMNRFGDMVNDFSVKNNLYFSITHDYDIRKSEVEFQHFTDHICNTCYYTVLWDEVKSLTDACTGMFTHVIRRWDLDGGNKSMMPNIKNVIFNNPATIVLWDDGTKTIVKCQDGDIYSKETGLALCITKKALGNKGNFNEVFKKWVPEEAILTSRPIEPLTVDNIDPISLADSILDEFKKGFARKTRGLVLTRGIK